MWKNKRLSTRGILSINSKRVSFHKFARLLTSSCPFISASNRSLIRPLATFTTNFDWITFSIKSLLTYQRTASCCAIVWIEIELTVTGPLFWCFPIALTSRLTRRRSFNSFPTSRCVTELIRSDVIDRRDSASTCNGIFIRENLENRNRWIVAIKNDSFGLKHVREMKRIWSDSANLARYKVGLNVWWCCEIPFGAVLLRRGVYWKWCDGGKLRNSKACHEIKRTSSKPSKSSRRFYRLPAVFLSTLCHHPRTSPTSFPRNLHFYHKLPTNCHQTPTFHHQTLEFVEVPYQTSTSPFPNLINFQPENFHKRKNDNAAMKIASITFIRKSIYIRNELNQLMRATANPCDLLCTA
jgi:hypothetical protein